MTILLSNDDGVHAPGLRLLCRALSSMDNIIAIAPAENRSGIGHAITFDTTVHVETLEVHDSGIPHLAVHGTPADAVKFALKHHLVEPPDLVVTGVNAGPNVGVNVMYSGTVGAAFEALIHGIDALAISAAVDSPYDDDAIVHYAIESVKIARSLQVIRTSEGIPRHPFCLNVNIPALPLSRINGLRFTKQGRSGFDEYFHLADEDTPDRYRIYGNMAVTDPDESYDAAALEAGYVSMTPLTIDFTDTALLDVLRRDERKSVE